MKIIWLASYPRSGNTWLRFLLYDYLYGEVENSFDVNVRIPPIHRPKLVDAYFDPMSNLPRPPQLLVKTHYRFWDGHPYAAATAGFIYICRHPRDVLLSNLNYHALHGMKFDAKAYLAAYVQLGGDPKWAQLGYGTWLEHIQSWVGANNSAVQKFPHLMLRYEDMKSDAAGNFRSILKFLSIEIDEAKLARTIEACSFEKLRELEAREKETGSDRKLFPGDKELMNQGHMFMNTGASGQSLEPFGPEAQQAFDARFAAAAARLNYS